MDALGRLRGLAPAHYVVNLVFYVRFEALDVVLRAESLFRFLGGTGRFVGLSR